MTSNKPKSLLDTLREREDDAAERKRQRKRETAEETISRFLDGEMSADEADTLTREHGEAIDRERMRRQETADRKEAQAEEHAAALWQDRYTRQDADAADRAIHEFCRRHPNFRRGIPRNGGLLLSELKRNNELVTLETLERAYHTLRPMGVFLDATPEEQAVARMSAEEFQRSRPELQERKLPPLIVRQTEKALLTFISEHPQYVASEKNRAAMMTWLSELNLPLSSTSLNAAFDALSRSGELELNNAVVTSGATTLTDCGDTKQNVLPPQLRKTIESMSADEIRERCNADPLFRESLDNSER